MSEYSSPVGKMLGKIAGTYDGDVPEPSNELEKGLKDIAENGGSSGGSGSGGNVLTLYGRIEDEVAGESEEGTLVVYIDPEYTKKQYDTYEEAYNAVMKAATIRTVGIDDTGKAPTQFIYYVSGVLIVPSNSLVSVKFDTVNGTGTVLLYGSMDPTPAGI